MKEMYVKGMQDSIITHSLLNFYILYYFFT